MKRIANLFKEDDIIGNAGQLLSVYSVVLTPLCWYLTDLSMNCRAYHQNESVQTKKTHAHAGSFKNL